MTTPTLVVAGDADNHRLGRLESARLSGRS